jgi:hypothetical protein
LARKSQKHPRQTTGTATLRNRVVERKRMLGSELTPNDRNWRTHPKPQADALRGVLEEIGQVGELYAYHSEREGGKLVLIDGHLRSQEFAGAEWDVAITDLTDAEADKLLACYDPLAAMAETNAKALDSLLHDVQTGSEAVADMLTKLAETNGIVSTGGEVELKPLDTRPPPKMTWVLLGIPTVRFGEIAETVEQLAAVNGILLETTSNDGPSEEN